MSEYKIPSAGLTTESLLFFMPSEYKSLPIHIFDTLDSTNVRAKQLAKEGAPHGTVVIAHQQTGGKGRLGRSFFSPREGIYLSVILRADSCYGESAVAFGKPTLLTLAAAVAVAESIEEICKKAAGIKWVNDIYVDGKKVSGILTEGITDFKTGQVNSLVVGIGINTSLKAFPPELLEIAGALDGDYSKASLVASVVCRLLDSTAELAENNVEQKRFDESTSVQERTAVKQATATRPTVPKFIKTYREKSLIVGKTVTVYKGIYRTDPQRELPGRSARVLDIDDSGGLCVIYTDGTRETLTSGEISIR